MPGVMNWWKSLWNSLTGAGLTQAQTEANQFSSHEAQISRNWTEAMYNKYESPAAIRQQYEEAGLNPALMYEGYQPSGVGGVSGSPSSVSPDSPQLLGLLSFLLESKKTNAEVKKTEAETEGIGIENSWKDYLHKASLEQTQVNTKLLAQELVNKKAELSKIFADTAKSLKESDLISEQIKTEQLDQGLKALEQVVKRYEGDVMRFKSLEEDWRYAYRTLYGVNPESSATTQIWDALTVFIGRLTGELPSFQKPLTLKTD